MLTGHLPACVSNPTNHKMEAVVRSDVYVDFAAPMERQKITSHFSRSLFAKLSILALLVAVAGFSTAAKNSCYYSRSNPVHYLSIASKMKVVHAAPVLDRTALEPVARCVPARPECDAARRDRRESPPVRQISVRVSLQHRSPPAPAA